MGSDVVPAPFRQHERAGNYFLIGVLLDMLGNRALAARFHAASVALDGSRADAHHRLGRSLEAIGDLAGAIAAYCEAVRRCPGKADYYVDISSALSNAGRFEPARIAAGIAVRLDPRCAEGYNLGHALLNLNRSGEALAPYEQAIALRQYYPRAQFGYAVALLKSGDFDRGWKQYEWRWQDCQRPRADFAVPVWRGEDLRDRTILLHAEQGFGDTLQFVRFAPMVAARGGRVVLEVPAPLVRLLRGVEGVAQIIARGDPMPPVDLQCPMASLPLAFGLQLKKIPARAYLPVPQAGDAAEAVAPWDRRAFPAGRRDMVVGLVWAGDPRVSELRSNLVDRRRSARLDMFAPLFGVGGVRFVSFQFGGARAQIADATMPIADAMEGVTDFADTAARLAGIDLLISVDTSIVHLAGGLGHPVWMLSRFDGCWRWLEGRDRTPWYPTMRIFRQPAPGDWAGLMAVIAKRLQARARRFRLNGAGAPTRPTGAADGRAKTALPKADR